MHRAELTTERAAAACQAILTRVRSVTGQEKRQELFMPLEEVPAVTLRTSESTITGQPAGPRTRGVPLHRVHR